MIANDVAAVSAKGARRWQQGHPWIYRSDVTARPSTPAGAVRVVDQRGKPIGVALWSPASEISLRMVDRDPRATLDRDWWLRRIGDAVARRAPLQSVANAYRLLHGEGDACPSLICDRYDRWLVVQLMSAGLETSTVTPGSTPPGRAPTAPGSTTHPPGVGARAAGRAALGP